MLQPIRPNDASGIYRAQVNGATPNEAAGEAARTAADRPTGAARRADSISLSLRAQELLRTQQAVEQAPDVRAERVDALRAQIASGTYSVEPQAIAQALASAAQGAGLEP